VACLIPPHSVEMNCICCFVIGSVKDVITALSPIPRITGTRPRIRKAESATIVTSSPFQKTLMEKEHLSEIKRQKTASRKLFLPGKGQSSGACKGKAFADGEGKSSATGKGKVTADGKGKSSATGKGKVTADGKGKSSATGKGKVTADGKGKSSATGKGKVTADGKGKSSATGKGKASADEKGKSSASSRKRTSGRNRPTKSRKRKRMQTPSDSEGEEEEWPCLICGETYCRPGEESKQCQECHNWAHDDCTDGGDYFICPNCETDDDDE